MQTFQEIKSKMSKLSTNERAALAEYLISTLDDEDNIDADAEKAWIEEAEGRYRAYLEGKIEATPSKIVFEEAFNGLK